MGKLVDETLNLLTIVYTEKICLNEDPMEFISVWSELAEENGFL